MDCRPTFRTDVRLKLEKLEGNRLLSIFKILLASDCNRLQANLVTCETKCIFAKFYMIPKI